MISSAITGAVVFGLCNKHFSDLKEKENIIQEIFEVKDYIDEFFYEDADDETLVTSALKGLVDGLDDDYAAYKMCIRDSAYICGRKSVSFICSSG